MDSGQFITWFMLLSVVIFAVWEFVQLARRRAGNKSALTMSQFVSKKIKQSKKWLIGITIWTVIVWLVMNWIILGHWPIFCEWFNILCWDI